MRKIRFLYLFPVLLALALFFLGCEDGPPPSTENPGTNPPPVTTTNNGTVYHAAVDGKHVFLSIYSPTTKAVIPPTTGNSYAVVVVTIDANGDSSYVPGVTASIAKGTISVDGSTLTFSSNSSKGTFNSQGITMTQALPGTSYTGLAMKYNKNVQATETYPFGLGDLLPNSTGGDGDGGDPGPAPGVGVTNPTSGAEYLPGGILVTEIGIITVPDWTKRGGTLATVNNVYYEGDPVASSIVGTNMQVKLYYNNGTSITINEADIGTYFVIDPPDFKNPSGGTGAKHHLYYRYGFTNSSTTTDDKLSPTFDGPKTAGAATNDTPMPGTIFPIGDLSGNVTDASFALKTPKTIAEWFEDDYLFNPYLEIYYNGGFRNNYWTENNPTKKEHYPLKANDNTSKGQEFKPYTSTVWPAPKIYPVKVITKNTDGSGTLSFETTNVYGDQGFTDTITIQNLLKVSKIALSKNPGTEIKEQILFDDLRLFRDDPNAKMYWLDKLRRIPGGLTLDITYTGGTTTSRKIDIVTAYNNAHYGDTADAHSLIAPPEYTLLTKAPLGIKYFNKTAAYEMPVYNILSNIVVKTPAGVPTMYAVNETGFPDGPTEFLGKIEVHTIYQKGVKGEAVERYNTYAQTQGDNRSCWSDITTSIDTGLLQSATYNWEKGRTTTKASVAVNPYGNNGAIKSGTVYIRAVGYK